MQAFLARAGTDVDSQAAVFNLDHAALDVIATMEGLALRPHELTHAGFVLLMTLWITGPRETRELAAVLRVTKGAIVGAVNTLERRGLVQRDRSPDRPPPRSVELTESGRDLISRVQKDWRALEVEVTSVLTVGREADAGGAVPQDGTICARRPPLPQWRANIAARPRGLPRQADEGLRLN